MDEDPSVPLLVVPDEACSGMKLALSASLVPDNINEKSVAVPLSSCAIFAVEPTEGLRPSADNLFKVWMVAGTALYSAEPPVL